MVSDGSVTRFSLVTLCMRLAGVFLEISLCKDNRIHGELNFVCGDSVAGLDSGIPHQIWHGCSVAGVWHFLSSSFFHPYTSVFHPFNPLILNRRAKRNTGERN